MVEDMFYDPGSQTLVYLMTEDSPSEKLYRKTHDEDLDEHLLQRWQSGIRNELDATIERSGKPENLVIATDQGWFKRYDLEKSNKIYRIRKNRDITNKVSTNYFNDLEESELENLAREQALDIAATAINELLEEQLEYESHQSAEGYKAVKIDIKEELNETL